MAGRLTAHGGSRYLQVVGRTAAINLLTTLLSAGTGVVLARVLGPDGRGDYAAVTAVFGLVLVVFEVGLVASLVYSAARDRERTDTQVRTVFVLLVPLSLLGSGFVVLAALSFLGNPAGRQIALLIAAGCVVVSFLGAPAVFALQALDIRRWNYVRFAQPALFALLLLASMTVFDIDVRYVVGIFGVTIALQGGLAWRIYQSYRLPRGHVARDQFGPLLRYGLSNVSATVPNAVNGRFDQVVLALVVAPAALGQYAVAVSLSLLVAPLALAFGNVAFPRIARGGDTVRTVRQAVWGSFAVAVTGVIIVVGTAPLLIPVLYGPGYEEVPRLLYLLAPGAAFFVVNQVVGDLLRGLGRPGLVAGCEWAGVVVTVIGLVALVPLIGAMGAAVTSSVAYIGVHVLLRSSLMRTRRATGDLRQDPLQLGDRPQS